MNFSSFKGSLTSVVLALALVGTAARADHTCGGAPQGFYVDANLGANVMQDIEFHAGGIDDKFSLKPGVRFSGAFGYMLRPTQHIGVGLEFETGVLYNSLDRATATQGAMQLAEEYVDGDYYQVPFLVNAVVVFQPVPKWSFSAGVGGGGNYSEFHLHQIGDGFVGLTGKETDGALQAMGGLRYQINPAMEVGLSYKYLAVFAKNLDLFITDADTIGNHSVMGSFTFHF
jgi:opacity protein-like surface antigen